MDKPKIDINEAIRETPALKEVVAAMIVARHKKKISVSWWTFFLSPGWVEDLAKKFNPENAARFELEWLYASKRGALKPAIEAVHAATAMLEPENAAYYAIMENNRAFAYAAAFYVWTQRRMDPDGKRFDNHAPNAFSYGVTGEDERMALEQAASGAMLKERQEQRLLTVRVDSAPFIERPENDPDIGDIAALIQTGQWPGTSIVDTNTGEIVVAPCRSFSTPGIIIGASDGTPYQRQANGSIVNLKKNPHKRF